MVHVTVRRAVGAWMSRAARARLRRRLGRVLAAAGEGESELSVLLCGDDEIRELNRGYAESDHATDVLSFSQREGLDMPEARLLGDIVVSLETAARQAGTGTFPEAGRAEGGEALEAEVLHLCVHGIAHLLGYDHATGAEQRAMWQQEAALRRVALGRAGRALRGASA